MRRTMVLAALLGLAAGPRAAKASVIFFTSRAAFNAAAPGLPVENFEEALVAAADIALMPNPLDQFTNNAIFHTGDILPGLRIASSDPAAALAIAGAGFSGIVPSKSVFGNTPGNGLVAAFFNLDVTAAGLDVLSYMR